MQPMRSIAIAWLLIVASTAAFGAEGALEMKGDLSFQQAATTRNGEAALSRKEVSVSASYGLDKCSAKLALRARSDTDLAPTHADYNEVREAAVVCRNDGWLLGVGRQTVVWGKVDNFRVLDVIHPFDNREFLLDDKESARRPLTMVRIERQMGEFDAAQLLLITERREDILPQPGARFSALYPQAALDRIATSRNAPSGSALDNSQIGFKWEHTGQQLGYTVNVLRHWAPQPSYANQADGTVARNVYRQTMLGGSVDLALSEWVLRGEAAYLPQVYLPTQPATFGAVPDYQRYGQLTWAIGVDRSIGEWLFNAQLLQTRINGGSSALLTDREQRLASIAFSRSYLQDRLKLRAFVARDLSRSGTWVSVSAAYDLSSAWELSTNLDLLDGDSASIFGKIKRESRLKIGIRARF